MAHNKIDREIMENQKVNTLALCMHLGANLLTLAHVEKYNWSVMKAVVRQKPHSYSFCHTKEYLNDTSEILHPSTSGLLIADFSILIYDW